MKLQARAAWSVTIWHTSPQYAAVQTPEPKSWTTHECLKWQKVIQHKQNQIIYTHNFTNQHLKLHSTELHIVHMYTKLHIVQKVTHVQRNYS